MTGINYQTAQWVAQSGQEIGAKACLVKVRKLAPPKVIAKNSLTENYNQRIRRGRKRWSHQRYKRSYIWIP